MELHYCLSGGSDVVVNYNTPKHARPAPKEPSFKHEEALLFTGRPGVYRLVTVGFSADGKTCSTDTKLRFYHQRDTIVPFGNDADAIHFFQECLCASVVRRGHVCPVCAGGGYGIRVDRTHTVVLV